MLKKGGALLTREESSRIAKNAPADLHYIATSCRDVPAHLHVRRDMPTACLPTHPRGGAFIPSINTMWKVDNCSDKNAD
jgi:hypothetical protein